MNNKPNFTGQRTGHFVLSICLDIISPMGGGKCDISNFNVTIGDNFSKS